jgi:outer membrane protein, multidrug efflux system
MAFRRAFLLLTTIALPLPAIAQIPVAVPPAPSAPGAPAASGTLTVPGAATSSPAPVGTVTEPPLPVLEDPMLAAPPPPANVLASWRDALQLVRARSTSLKMAEAQVRVASADARAALSNAYPTLTAHGSVRRHLLFGTGLNLTADGPQTNVRIPDPAQVWGAGLSFRQPLIAPRVWHEAGTAELAINAAETRVADSERLVLAQVADTIVAVVTAERLAEISRVSLQSSLYTLDLTRRRALLGAGNKVDVLRAEQEVELNRAQVVNVNEALRRSREALGMALGYPEAWGVTHDIQLDDLARDAQQVCRPLSNIEERADVRGASVDVEVAERRVHSSDWLLSPTLDLVSDLDYSTSPSTANGTPTTWTIGALLTIPLYDGGAKYAEQGAATARASLSREVLTQTKRQATMEVEQALRSVVVAEQNLEVSGRSRDLARETSRLARLSFVNGQATSFELVDAARRYQEAELDLAVKEFDVVRARIIALLAKANCDV